MVYCCDMRHTNIHPESNESWSFQNRWPYAGEAVGKPMRTGYTKQLADMTLQWTLKFPILKFLSVVIEKRVRSKCCRGHSSYLAFWHLDFKIRTFSFQIYMP